jgi:hypothetical protein
LHQYKLWKLVNQGKIESKLVFQCPFTAFDAGSKTKAYEAEERLLAAGGDISLAPFQINAGKGRAWQRVRE